MRRSFTVIIIVPLFLVIFSACQKSNDTKNTYLTIKLTDKHFTATEVNVDIRQVRINLGDDSASWIDLHTNAGVYNLLNLQNGIDTILAQAIVPAGTVNEVRFILGSNNSIIDNNTVYPLTIPSGSETGIKIKLEKQLNATFDTLTIDFDAGLSILQTGPGNYKLKPVLQVK